MKKEPLKTRHRERYKFHPILSHDVTDKSLDKILFEGISKRMKEIRKELKITQRELGETAGIDRRYIAKVECGSQNPSFKVIRSLSIRHKLSVDWLVYGIGEKYIQTEPEKYMVETALFKNLLDRANADEIDMVMQMLKKMMKK